MMRDNLMILLLVLVIISILSVIWYIIFTSYIKKVESKEKKKKGKTIGFLKQLKPTNCLTTMAVICSILLVNSDEEITKALHHIEPSKHTDNLLEKLYGQNRI